MWPPPRLLQADTQQPRVRARESGRGPACRGRDTWPSGRASRHVSNRSPDEAFMTWPHQVNSTTSLLTPAPPRRAGGEAHGKGDRDLALTWFWHLEEQDSEGNPARVPGCALRVLSNGELLAQVHVAESCSCVSAMRPNTAWTT